VVDFINEVEEELRKDEYNRLLKKFGPLLIGIVALIIGGTAFMEWQKSSEDKAARATSYAYVQAGKLASDGKNDEAIRDFLAISEKAPSGYAGLSLMRAAAISLREGERAQAVSFFDRAAQTFELPRHKQLAQIKAAYILAGDGRYDDVRSRLGSLAQPDQPYEYLARELLGFAAMQTGDMSAAREQFSYLSTIPGVTETIAARAAQYLSLMAVDTQDAALAIAPTDETDEPKEDMTDDE
jgi:hypothetical protein